MSSKSRNHPPEAVVDDAQLFRQAVGKVRELNQQLDPLRASRPLAPPEPTQSLADERQVLRELLTGDEALIGMASGEVLAHLRNGYPAKLLRQLRRGQYVVEAELDLHHLRQHEARALLGRFLIECRRDRHRCVRIIHGKSKGTEHGSVLKAMTDRVLRQRDEVIGFTSARPQDGGTGAVLVLLQAPR